MFHVGEYLPHYFEVLASIRTEKPIAGYKANSYVVFDYVSPTDFKFAGINISTDKLEIGHRDAGGWHVDAQVNAKLRPDVEYDVLLSINGVTATLVVGRDVLSHAFEPRTDPDGFTYGLNYGMVGLGAQNAIASIDNVVVQVLKPDITFAHDDDFSDGIADLFTAPADGIWRVEDGRYDGAPLAGGEIAFSTFDLSVGPNSWLEFDASLTADSLGGFFFDYYGDRDYKFAGLLPDGDQVVIGHWGRNGAFTYDAVADITFAAGPEFDLRLSLKGTTASVAVDGHEVLGHVFNAVTVDGGLGLLTKDGAASFDSFAVRTDDLAFAADGEALTAAFPAPAGYDTSSPLTADGLAPVAREAVQRLGDRLALDPETRSALGALTYEILDLRGLGLAQTENGVIQVDLDAAGHGWFVDPTPADDHEFARRVTGTTLEATPESGAYGRMDLLTAVMHELGHVVGLEHVAALGDLHDLMAPTLEPGLRHLIDGEPILDAVTPRRGAGGSPGPLSNFVPVAVLDAGRGNDSVGEGLVDWTSAAEPESSSLRRGDSNGNGSHTQSWLRKFLTGAWSDEDAESRRQADLEHANLVVELETEKEETVLPTV